MVIVGFGFLKEYNKFYWLIQNSFGDTYCYGGLFKIEFVKVGEEQVAFSEPDLPINDDIIHENLNISLIDIDKRCNLIIKSLNESFNVSNGWYGDLEINFVNEKGDNFSYYCSSYDFIKGNNIICFYEIL